MSAQPASLPPLSNLLACWLIPAAELQVTTPPAAPAATPGAAAPTTLEQKPIADTVHTHDAHMPRVWQAVSFKILFYHIFLYLRYTYLLLCVTILFRPVTAWDVAVLAPLVMLCQRDLDISIRLMSQSVI